MPRAFVPVVQVEIWSDVVCPWCYLGKRRFERALAGFEHRDQVEVTFRSFELDPRAPREPQPKAALLAAKYGISEADFAANEERLTQLAAAEGLEYHLDGGVIGNTFDAHRVLHLARERGLQDAVAERFFRAYFTERRSVFEVDSLVELATEAGLDGEEVRRVLEDGSYADEVRADVDQARAFGANGVPFFVFDRRYGVSGAQSVETFAAALDKAYQDAGPVPK
ncbi:DsbA family oxidoreductase [Amycolatopsis thermophila]|uniref:DsbA family dithiol-disulfide isomerase n=1 Tax=Amycolatopsis thermophila TaxID=206084 RepID=A0ABU0ERB7_9PSEU|nr:DsbA family oxidoreductase [Amycolatopsis thermophila]MDQ0377633.1 putative DsbA family dithiol-disulfide isomerase [Amycolatopsis thermophila]